MDVMLVKYMVITVDTII